MTADGSELKHIASSLKEVSRSLNGVQQEFAGMKTQQAITNDTIKTLSSEVAEMGKSIVGLDGKTKGLRADIERVEKAVSSSVSCLKTEDIPMIAKDKAGEVLSNHEDRLHFKTKRSPSENNIQRPEIEVARSNFNPIDADKVMVPKWLVFTGIFIGSLILGGGYLAYKLLIN